MGEPGDGRASRGAGATGLRGRAPGLLLTGCVSGLAGGAADAYGAWTTAARPAGRLPPLVVADVGLLVPVAWAVTLAAAVGARFLVPPGFESPRAARSSLAGFPPGPLLVAPFAALAAWLVLADLARRVLVAGAPPGASGAALALAAAVTGAAAAAAVALLGGWLDRRGIAPRPPLVALAMGTVTVGVLALTGVRAGPTSGDGVLGLLGVFRREELDVRGVGLLLAFVVAAYAGPDLLAAPLGRTGSSRSILVAAAIGIGCLGFVGRVCVSGPAGKGDALALERGAPLGGKALALYRTLSDRDRDGASARFGGGDCDDSDPRVSPFADDVPGNGVDEDCSGRDEPAPPASGAGIADDAPGSAAAAASTAARDLRSALPRDLSVVLVTVDTLRGDLGFAGNPRPVSPNLDALARDAVVFERAYSLASYTGKSVGPLLIGKYPSETHRSFEHFDRFRDDETFVQERLARAHVRTLAAQGHWYFEPSTGLGRGFDVFDRSAAPAVPQAEGDRTVNGDRLTDAAIGLLSAPDNVSGRFYLWVHYLDPHAEYVRHEEHDFGAGTRARYDGEVAFEDRQIGRLVDFVRRGALGPRTAIVVTSDHGEAFGEHGMVRHGFELWEELVRVPLVVLVPGLPPRRVAARRSAIDLVPTLLDLFGLEAPSRDAPDFVSGRSLLPDLVQPPGYRAEERPVFVDMPQGPYNAERQAFVEGDLKLVASRGVPIGLYDLARDPAEKVDLLPDAERAEPAIRRYKAFRRGIRSVAAR